jgi:hypothetical protein
MTARRPEDARAWNTLAWFLVDPAGDPKQWDPPAALRAARESIARTPADDPQLPFRLDTLAEALFRTGDVAAAIESEEKALRVGNALLRPSLEASLARYRAARLPDR